MIKDSWDEIKSVTDQAIDLGFENAHEQWKAMALKTLFQTCLKFDYFTANDFRDEILKSPIQTHDLRAMGGVMKTGVKNGWIEKTGRSIPSRVGHKVPLQIWKSNFYKPNDLQS